MRADVCFDAATEGTTGGRQTNISPVVVAKLQDRDTPKDAPVRCCPWIEDRLSGHGSLEDLRVLVAYSGE
jgi:hypothetical protein